ncbi:hypothetical protein [Metamycoplasma buccale]|uniref:hypothetical protein n=1 Tax=Metamycoplasma buccale TaxID=55602 RepID=UPI00398E7FDD
MNQIEISVLNKNNKINTSIVSINDLEITNIDRNKYRIINLKIEYPTNESLKLIFQIKNDVVLISKERIIVLEGFKKHLFLDNDVTKKLTKSKLNDFLNKILISLNSNNESIYEIVNNWKSKNYFNIHNLNNHVNFHIKGITKKDAEHILIIYFVSDKNDADNISDFKEKELRIGYQSNFKIKEKIKEYYPGDIEQSFYENNNTFGDIDWSQNNKKLWKNYVRKSSFGNKESKINELAEIFDKLHSSYQYDGIDLRSQYFESRNMTEGLIK